MSVILSLAGVGIALGLSLGYTIKENNRQDRDLCEVIKYVDDRNQKIASPTPEQREAIEVLHRYRVKLRCAEVPGARAPG